MKEEKLKRFKKLLNKDGVISAIAFDQRGALKKMFMKFQSEEPTKEELIKIKEIITKELSPFGSAMLLDPEYGISASRIINENTGIIFAYEKTGYDTSSNDRMPDCLDEWSVKRLKELGADAIKFLIYYDVDSPYQINHNKQAYIERIGSECEAEGLPFFLEILTYDVNIKDKNSKAYARIKPRKVIEAMKVFSNPRFNVDVLKVEIPVNMNFVEGFSNEEEIYSKEQAANYFASQAESTKLPYIFLSGGVSSQLFQETLIFASQSGAKYNGVLCGRATWAESIEIFSLEGERDTRHWLQSVGKENINKLNYVLQRTAKPLEIINPLF